MPPKHLTNNSLAGVLGSEFRKVRAKIRRLASSSCGYLSVPLSVVVSTSRPLVRVYLLRVEISVYTSAHFVKYSRLLDRQLVTLL